MKTSTKEINSEDVYVPLRNYVTDYSKSEYKGGHHASSIEHDRRGYYRKSRGRGDYKLIDSKMVYVGDMRGDHSYVKAAHIKGRKSNGVKIYKV